MEFIRKLFPVYILLLVSVSAQDVRYTIEEEVPKNTPIGNIEQDSSVLDMVGADSKGSLTYSILTSGNVNAKLFNINTTSGDLFTAARVDRETLCPFTLVCSLSLEIAVRSERSFFSYKIEIIVNDTNDNRPSFAKDSMKLEISESTQIGVSFSFDGAVDNDTEINSIQNYTISPEDVPFDVEFMKNLDGTSTVSLVVSAQLDREITDKYELTLFAKDNGSPLRSGSMMVYVTVADSNDNAPDFSSSIYNATVKENTPVGTIFLKVNATDRDAGNNSVLFYRLSNRQPKEYLKYFEIDRKSGEMKVKAAPPSGEMRVIVEANDQGTPPKESQAFVDITVLDTNNQQPFITVNLFNGGQTAHISEFKKPGYAFAHVKVSDPDTGDNGDVKCLSKTFDFELQPLDVKEYTVIVSSVLDRELTAKYTLTIFCEDNGKPKLNATFQFAVEIDDENDNKPKFLQDIYTISIPENNAVNDTILQVAATDRDIGNNSKIIYEISEDGKPYFFFQPGSSVIRAKISFDRESEAEYKFHVLAIDGGVQKFTSTVNVEISVVDLNDERPAFGESAYTFYIMENSPRFTIVGNVSATDRDSGNGGTFSFVLSPSFKLKPLPFRISDNGSIISLNSFDAERETEYTFQVIATDHALNPLTGVADVKVVILDKNEYKPYFLFPNNINSSVTVYAPHKEGAAVLWIQAFDDDVGDGEKLEYSLEDKNRSGIFRIDSLSGKIILKMDIQESQVGNYEFFVTASDMHTPPQFHTETLKVQIKYKQQEQLVKRDHNIVIVIAIVCVTVVIAATVFVALCYLRRQDKELELKRTFSTSSAESKEESGVTASEVLKVGLTQSSDKNDVHLRREKHGDERDGQAENQEHYKNVRFDGTSTNQRNHLPQQSDMQLLPHHTHLKDVPKNKKFWMESVRHPDEFLSNSSGEVTTGDSGHGSDEDLTFHEGFSQSPRSFKHAYPHANNHWRSSQQRSDATKFLPASQTHKLSYPTAHRARTEDLPQNYGNILLASKSSGLNQPASNCSSLNHLNNSSSPFGQNINFKGHGGLQHHRTLDTLHCSDDDTTTSGSYSVTLEDVRTDLGEFATDVYV